MNILFEDNHLIAIEKKFGELVQGDETGDETLADDVKRYLVVKYNKPGDAYLGIPHRLDRPVTGVVLFCKTSKALKRVNQAFKDRKVTKEYVTIVEGIVAEDGGNVKNYLRKKLSINKSFVAESGKNAKLASLDFKRIAVIANFTLLKINLHTGRPHQIRAQLSNMGHPILGDLKYGASTKMSDRSLALHARRLRIEHPVEKIPMVITSRMPSASQWKMFSDFFDEI